MLLLLVMVAVASASELTFKSTLLDPAWHDVISEGGLQISSGRLRRFIALNHTQANIAHQACLLPDGTGGSCRHLRHCIQEEFRTDFLKFLEYLCIIDNSYLGSCCPDNAKRGGAQGLAGDLPATAPEDEGNDVSVKLIKTETRGCGQSTRRQSSTHSGKTTTSRDWPWMVSVTPLHVKNHCGGSLITERHVLTAAHCVTKYKPKDLIVRLGEYDFERNDETRVYDLKVAEIHTHELYEPISRRHDISILKMHKSCLFNTYVWPICLPPPDLNLTDQITTLIGWGTRFFGGPTSSVLEEVSIPVWDQNTCVNSLVDTVFDENLCAGGHEGGKDACQYDSGGPLMYQMPSGRWTVVGVVSWGMRCGEPKHPGIYVRVDKYLPWILQNTDF